MSELRVSRAPLGSKSARSLRETKLVGGLPERPTRVFADLVHSEAEGNDSNVNPIFGSRLPLPSISSSPTGPLMAPSCSLRVSCRPMKAHQSHRARETSKAATLCETMEIPGAASVSSSNVSPGFHHERTAAPLASLVQPSSLPSSVINLSFCGEAISFDLKCLEEDSLSVIELLKLTRSDCGNWMMVGVAYRRLGNTPAAILVIETMLNVMTEQGLSEGDLKPAYLLLSGCEADMAKRVNPLDPHTAKRHLKASQKWLQKVYGKLNSIDANSRLAMVSTTPREPHGNKKTDSMSISVPLSIIPRPPTTREDILQREVRSLIDAKNEQTMVISSMKRKFEEDIGCERDGRRRLMREIDGLERELLNAKKKENFALAQVRREVAARRKAEEDVREARAMNQKLVLQMAQESHRRTQLVGVNATDFLD